MEDPDMTPHSYTHLIFDKGTKDIKIEKRVSPANVAEKMEYLHAED
jgi:hypothetical protein